MPVHTQEFQQVFSTLDADTQRHVTALLSRANDEAMLDLVRSAQRKKYRRLITEGKLEDLGHLRFAVMDIGEEYFKPEPKLGKDVSSKNTEWLITINAKPNINFLAFFKQMEKVIKKKGLEGSGTYTLEQRSEGNEEPHGWHIHWMVKFDNPNYKGTYLNKIEQCFKSYIGSKEAIDFKPWNDHTSEYVRGVKTKDKMAKAEKDKILRNKYDLPHFISY